MNFPILVNNIFRILLLNTYHNKAVSEKLKE